MYALRRNQEIYSMYNHHEMTRLKGAITLTMVLLMNSRTAETGVCARANGFYAGKLATRTFNAFIFSE